MSKGKTLESDAEEKLKGSLKSKNGFPLKVKLDTKVMVKMGKLKTPNVRIGVTCNGIRVHLPVGKKPATATTLKAKCEADIKFKIWKWSV